MFLMQGEKQYQITRLLSKIESFNREDIPAYPELAVREVLINALCPFGLFSNWFYDSGFNQNVLYRSRNSTLCITLKIKAGVSKIRNRVIARIFRELGLMEEWGSGYKRVVNACRAGGYPEPEWTELGAAVRVVFYPHRETIENGTLDVPANVPANERQKWFLKQIGKNIRVSSSDIAAHWGVSQKTAKRDIADLKQKGLIEFLGAPKSGYYCLKS